MRPRLIAVDDRLGILSDDVGELASMRPRLIAVDDADMLAGSSIVPKLQ